MKKALAILVVLVMAILASSCETMTMVTPWGPEVKTSWQGGFHGYSNLIVIRNDSPYLLSIVVGRVDGQLAPNDTTRVDVFGGIGNCYAAQNISFLITATLYNGRTVSVTPNVYVDTYNRQIRTLVIEQNQWSGISYHW
jgi:hypothetical protein